MATYHITRHITCEGDFSTFQDEYIHPNQFIDSDFYTLSLNDNTNVDVELELVFDPGEYTLGTNLWGCQFYSDPYAPFHYLNFTKVIFRGLGGTEPGGQNRAILKVDEVSDFMDDAFINIQGKIGKECSVVISNIDIVTDVDATAAVTIPKGTPSNPIYLRRDIYVDSYHLIKIYNASSVLVENVLLSSANLPCTCLDLRWCDNVTIKDSKFVNYNRRVFGGCLWLRGYTNNVLVKGNEFRKRGNDEIIAIWGDSTIDSERRIILNDYDDDYIDVTVMFSNIRIVENDFYVDSVGNPINVDSYNDSRPERDYEAPWNGTVDVPIAIFTNEVNQQVTDDVDRYLAYYIMDNVIIADNKFTTYAPIYQLIRLSFNSLAEATGFRIYHNTINHSDWINPNGQLINFCVSRTQDINFELNEWQSNDDIMIENNFVTSHCLPYIEQIDANNNVTYRGEEYYFIMANGVNIVARANTLTHQAVQGSITLDRSGAVAVLCNNFGARIIMHKNRIQTLYCLVIAHGPATATGVTDNINELSIDATDNRLTGDTFTSVEHVTTLKLSFVNNELRTCTHFMQFLVIGQFEDGTVVFERNRFYNQNANASFPLLTDSNTLNIQTSLALVAKSNIFHSVAMNHNPYSAVLSASNNNPGIRYIIYGDTSV